MQDDSMYYYLPEVKANSHMDSVQFEDMLKTQHYTNDEAGFNTTYQEEVDQSSSTQLPSYLRDLSYHLQAHSKQ